MSPQRLAQRAALPLWRYPAFLLLLGGYGLSRVGDYFFELAIEWNVFATSGSSLHVAVVGVGFQLAYTLIGPAAGVFADRWDRRRTLIWCDALRGLVVLGAAVVVWLGSLPFWAAASTVFVLESIGQFFYASRQAFIPLIVPHEELIAANGMISGVSRAAAIGGQALGGIVVMVAGTPMAFIADAVSFWISALSVWLIHPPRPLQAEISVEAGPARAARVPVGGWHGGWSRFWSEMREGWDAIAAVPVVRSLVGYSVLINFAFAMFQPVVPAYVSTQLHLGAWAFGLVQSAVFAGGLAGGFLAGVASRRVAAGRAVILTFWLFGLAMVGLGLSGSLPLALALWAFSGVILTVNGAVVQALNQVLIPQAVMGRSFALMSAAGMGLMPLGTLIGGYLGNLMGPGPVFMIVGAAEAVLALLMAIDGEIRCADVRATADKPEDAT